VIYIKENYLGNKTVVIQVDGILDRESIPILRNIFTDHLGEKVSLDLQGLLHISREGRTFLREFEGKITLIDPSRFMDKQ